MLLLEDFFGELVSEKHATDQFFVLYSTLSRASAAQVFIRV